MLIKLNGLGVVGRRQITDNSWIFSSIKEMMKMKDDCRVRLRAEEVEVKNFPCIKNEMYAYGTYNGEVRQVMSYKNDRMEWRDSFEPVLGSRR